MNVGTTSQDYIGRVKNKQITNNPLQIKNCDTSVKYILTLYSKDSIVVFTQNDILFTSKYVFLKIGFTH